MGRVTMMTHQKSGVIQLRDMHLEVDSLNSARAPSNTIDSLFRACNLPFELDGCFLDSNVDCIATFSISQSFQSTD
eukprot:5095886-Pyramimonas_sp.AAC.6